MKNNQPCHFDVRRNLIRSQSHLTVGRVLICVCITIGFVCGVKAQTVNAEYLNPKFSTSGNYDFLRFGNAGNYVAGFMNNVGNASYGNGSDFSIFTYGNRDLTFRTGTGNFIIFPSSGGKVGINTTSPTEKLELSNGSIYGFNASDAFVKIKRRQGQASIKGVFDGTSGYDGHVIIDAGRTSDAVFLNHYISSNVYLVNGGGKVGIGTSTPENKLTVLGQFGLYGSGLDGSTYQRFVLYSDAQNGLYFDAPKDANGNKLPIEFNWRGGGITPLRINGDGNVGIGTTTPDEKLTVKGKIHTEEVRVDLSVPAPDYVFADNYNLPTLESIEKFIKSESHLPEIPSAKEMEENGVELGTMNMLLLKKIEELTLYQIELLKRLDNQNARIEKLEKN